MIVKMFILLYSRSMMIARGVLARLMYPPASVRHRWLGATEACKYKPFLSPPPISPIAAPSEEQNEHEDNENEIHNLPPKCLAKISHLHMWVQNKLFNSPRILPTTILTGAVIRLSTFRVYCSRPRPDTVASMNGTYVHRRRT